MTSKQKSWASWVLALCIALQGATFVIDLLLPVGVSTGMLYAAILVVSLWLPWQLAPVALALIGSMLTVVGYQLSPPDPLPSGWEPIVNRGLSIFAIWAVALLAMRYRGSIAALRRSEEDLRLAQSLMEEREARLRSILDTAPEALITIDERGIVESFSRSAEDMFGYRADEIVGKNVSMLMPAPHREEHDRYIQRYLRTGERRIIGVGRVVSARRKDGVTFPIELAVGEARVGRQRLFTGFIRDLTARQRMEQELRQAQKMEAVGQLTGGVAHDFNNLLTVILGNLEMLEAYLDDDARQRELLREAQEAAVLGAQVTERLLAFGRRQPLQPKPVRVGELITQTTQLLRRTLDETIELRTEIADDLYEIVVDPGQFENALLNLAVNARDAMPKGGVLTIAADNAEIDADYAKAHADMQQGRYVVVSVTDTGTGMSPEVRERAFEPFFTTKGLGSGTGLGLSMVYGFAKQSGGHAQLYSEVGQGTTARLYLPRVPEASEAREPTSEQALTAFRAQGETVLIAEDDARVRRVSVGRLRILGYQVLEAENGPAALEVIKAHPNIDLLFTDVVMPGGMSGGDLARAARRLQPNLKVLFTSGYAEPNVAREGVAEGGEWLKKPSTALDLARTLREMLDA